VPTASRRRKSDLAGGAETFRLGRLGGEIETRALVTERLRPFELDGRRIYQIGLPWHFGWQGFATVVGLTLAATMIFAARERSV
jgi:hypothetical protein